MKLDEIRMLTSDLKNSRNPAAYLVAMDRLRQMGIDPERFYQEMEMTSRFVQTHRDSSVSNTSVTLHSHTFYELLYCRSNAGVEYLVGSDRYRLQKGDIVFIAPGVSHRPILPERMPEPYERDVLWISADFANDVLKMFPDETAITHDHSSPIRTWGTRWQFLGDMFRQGVLESEKREPGWETAVLGNTLMIFSYLKRAYIDRSAGMLKAEKPELLDRITAYIEENYEKHITIGDLARQFYVSDSTVSHLFKQKMGVSVYRYITQRRLIAAKTKIQRGMQMEDVSREVGFSDYSTFYRAFKQEFGISPKQFSRM